MGTFFQVNAVAGTGRTRRNADSITSALGSGIIVEPFDVLDNIAGRGASKQLDRELRKPRAGRDSWFALEESSITAVLDSHVGAQVALLSHPNGRVRLAAIDARTDPSFPAGTLRTLVHRCTDRVEPIADAAQRIISSALTAELERSDRGVLATPIAHAVSELRGSADLVIKCPALVTDALELSTSSWQPRRRLTLRTQHRYAQLADYLDKLVVAGDASDEARKQLIDWLTNQLTKYSSALLSRR